MQDARVRTAEPAGEKAVQDSEGSKERDVGAEAPEEEDCESRAERGDENHVRGRQMVIQQAGDEGTGDGR